MGEPFIGLSHVLADYFEQMSLMIVATVLVVFGDLLNKQVKRSLRPYPFIVRISLFILLCAFGYGALTLLAAPWVAKLYNFIPYSYRGLAFILTFIGLGFAAENRRYI